MGGEGEGAQPALTSPLQEIKSTAPVYSFGIKPGGWPSGQSPAPNAYNLSGGGKDRPSYSLSARIPELSKFLTPAPGSYEVEFSHFNIAPQTPVGSWDKPSLAKGFNINQSIFVIRPALLKTTWINHPATPWLWDIPLLLIGWRSQGPGPTCQRRSTPSPQLRSLASVRDTPSLSLKPNMTRIFLWDHCLTNHDNLRSKLISSFLISWLLYMKNIIYYI